MQALKSRFIPVQTIGNKAMAATNQFTELVLVQMIFALFELTAFFSLLTQVTVGIFLICFPGIIMPVRTVRSTMYKPS